MSWVKLDDQFFAHPKIINLSKDAKLLHLAALTYCASQLTDGMLTPGAVRMASAQVDAEPACIAELVTAGVWEMDGANYRIHDYLVYNPSGEEVKAERARTAQRVAAWRSRHPKSNAVTNGASNASPVPVPVPLNQHTSDGESLSKRESVAPTNEGEPLARTRTPSQQAKTTAEKKKSANRPAEPKPRPKNPLWDVLCEVFYPPSTPDEKKLFGKIVHDLNAEDVRASPDDVRARVRAHQRAQSHWDLTPRALITHWSELGALCARSNGHGTTESARRTAAEREAALDEERARQHAEMVRELAQRPTG